MRLSNCEANLILPWRKIVLIGFDKAGKRFGTLDAVKEFSLTIKDEEILGLLGPNGAGKTNIMLMIDTVYRHKSRNLYVNGFKQLQDPKDVQKMNRMSFDDNRVS